MKFALATICLAVLLIGVQSAPQSFNLGGLEGVIDGVEIIDGQKRDADGKSFSKAEEIIKAMIHKHLDDKRQAKKRTARKEKAPKSSAQAVIPASINWDDHPETRAVINEKIPGGTASVDALLKMIHESGIQQ